MGDNSVNINSEFEQYLLNSYMKKIIIFNVFLLITIMFSNCAFIEEIFRHIEIKEKDAILRLTDLSLRQIENLEKTGSFQKQIDQIETRIIFKEHELGYEFEMNCDGKSFQIWAIPKEYGSTGKKSFYVDSNDINIRGADHKGEKANSNDPIVEKIPDEWKEVLRTQNNSKQ